MNCNCLIVDDEHLAMDLLENYIHRKEGYRVIGKIANPAKVAEIIQTTAIDLIFLDIHMPQMNGITMYKQLPFQPPIIFTTAYTDHAIAAFELDAIDYLVKPYSFERFEKAIEKYSRLLRNPTEKTEPFLQIKKEGTWYNVKHSQIMYIEGWKEYVRIHCYNNEQYTVLMSMSSLEEKLPQTQFIRVHKSYIASISAIIGFNKEEVVMINQAKLPISRSKKDVIVAQLKFDK